MARFGWKEATLLEKLSSLSVWVACILFIGPMAATMLLLQHYFHPADLEPISRFFIRGFTVLCRLRWRAEVHPDVDPDRPYIFCQNHVNHLDFFICYRATPHFKQGLELEDHFRWPVYGWVMKQRGTIPVRPGMKGQVSELTEAFRREIEQGDSILAFPEGRRTLDGRVGPFRSGVFYIARDLGIPIVPVAVTGTQDVMRVGSLLIRPDRNVTVYCEEPVETAGVPDEEMDALVERVRGAIARRVDEYLAGRQEVA
jgi:1-acyl-sn-glycerol-3-phosphate acyltransferase